MEKHLLTELVFASHNKGKIAEVRQLLAPLGIKIISADDTDLPDVEETGTTFEENAALKACAIAEYTGKTALADDSGLCVAALDFRPGVYSARYAPDRDFDKGMDKLLAEIRETGKSDRSAYFACVLVLASPDGKYQAFEGRVNGRILEAKQGNGGFGFDPVFAPEGYTRSFAELGHDVKNRISHRGRAMEKLVAFLKRK
jgi:XTP/dITP diphosphohydrolase